MIYIYDIYIYMYIQYINHLDRISVYFQGRGSLTEIPLS